MGQDLLESITVITCHQSTRPLTDSWPKSWQPSWAPDFFHQLSRCTNDPRSDIISILVVCTTQQMICFSLIPQRLLVTMSNVLVIIGGSSLATPPPTGYWFESKNLSLNGLCDEGDLLRVTESQDHCNPLCLLKLHRQCQGVTPAVWTWPVHPETAAAVSKQNTSSIACNRKITQKWEVSVILHKHANKLPMQKLSVLLFHAFQNCRI